MIGIKITTKNRIDTKKIKRSVQKAQFRSIEHAAAYTRKIILSSIRTGKMQDNKRIPSPKGKPPRTWNNFSQRKMKRDILYKTISDIYGKSIGTIYASPEKAGDTIYQAHERGGMHIIETYKKDSNSIVANREKRGSRSEYRSLAERSEKERKAIKNYYNNIFKYKRTKVSIRVNYPARPFMTPAIKKILPKLPEIWKANVQKQFH